MIKIAEIVKSIVQKYSSEKKILDAETVETTVETISESSTDVEETLEEDNIRRYEVGQKVRIKNNFSKIKPNDSPGVSDEMLFFSRKIVTIGRVFNNRNYYEIKEDDRIWTWHYRWFEMIDSKEILEIENGAVTLYREKNGQRKKTKKIKLQKMMEKIRERNFEIIQTPALPEGTRFYFKQSDTEVVVIEQFPQTRTVFWADKTKDELHSMTERNKKQFLTTLSFPYVIFILICFKGEIDHGLSFYRNESLKSLDDKLCHTNLKNVRWTDDSICIGSVIKKHGDMKKQSEEYLNLFWQSSFNNDISESFDESFRKIKDERISYIENWREASKNDPSFITKIPWVKSGDTVQSVIQKTIEIFRFRQNNLIETTDDLIDLVFQIEED